MPGAYTLREKLSEGRCVVVYRAVRNADGRAVILKVLDARSYQPRDVERIRNEFEVGRALDSPAVVRPLALEMHEGGPALVMEDFGGAPLGRLLEAGEPMPLPQFLPLALRIAKAVAQVHELGLVHKDLKPENILIDTRTGEVRIADLGIASLLPREEVSPRPSRLIEGTLPYISPEQTGRMNRPVDSRSDLYSLGVTFYQMLTGRLPFHAADPPAWVHCHIARRPLPPAEWVPSLPATLSGLVLKLLAKLPEERYQRAAGLAHDLERCLFEWRTRGQITPFSLAELDLSECFSIPRKLYGREAECAALLAAFERMVAAGTPELMLVSGYSGIGKSSLVGALQAPIVRRRGFFVSGKCDQFRRDTPHPALVRACQKLVLEILSESEERIADWKLTLEDALGRNARLIADMVPEVGLVIGEKPPVPELPPAEAENRLFLVFRQFIRVFAQKDHPLTVFIDDLQWADAASLRLLQHVSTDPDAQYLFMIGAYRDNEVGPSHPLLRAVEQVRKGGHTVHELRLRPLSVAQVGHLLADTVHRPPAEVAELARLVQTKTGGNPFFAIHFLSALERRGLVAFDRAEGRWRWDTAQIAAEGLTDNVVELVIGKLRILPPATQELLKLIACLGDSVDARTLESVTGRAARENHAILRPALEADLLLTLDEVLRFAHDRVEEAAYSLIPESERAAMHLAIGRSLQSSPEASAFQVVNQLNLGSSLLDTQAERDRLAELNLAAGDRAQASTAYASAGRYFSAGAALLEADPWARRHELAFSLQLGGARCHYLTGKLEEAERTLSVLMAQAQTPVEAGAVAFVKVNLLATQNRYEACVEAARIYLRRVGIELDAHPTRQQVVDEYQRTWLKLGARSIEELIDLPPMRDPLWQGAMEVLAVAVPPATATEPNLCSLFVCHVVQIGLQHGHADASGYGYAIMGSIVGPVFGDYASSFRFGQLAYDLTERRHLVRFRGAVYNSFAHSISVWCRHVRTHLGLLRRSFDAALEAGDLNYACYGRCFLVSDLVFAGEPIDDILREAEKGIAFVRATGYDIVVHLMTSQLRLLLSLQGKTRALGSFDDAEFDEQRFEAQLAEGGRTLSVCACFYFTRKLQARFMAGEYAQALQAARKAVAVVWTSPTYLEAAELRLYTALTWTACYEQLPAAEQAEARAKLAVHRERFAAWERSCPENFRDRRALIDAEIARIDGRSDEAAARYEEAILAASESGFQHGEALAHELASRFYRARGFQLIADSYLREARRSYQRWGAHGKVRQIDQLRPGLGETRALEPTQSTLAVRSEQLDLMSVVKASQTISREIAQDRLLLTLLQVVLEQGGARTARLVLPRHDQLTACAEATIDDAGVHTRLLASHAEDPGSLVPLSIVHYVRRTKQRVRFDDAAADAGGFGADEYIARKRPRSLLCLPILRQGAVSALLYLENDLVTGAFTPDRLLALELIASQSAISLENALLLEQERIARGKAELLAEVTELLSSVLEYPLVLGELAKLCVRTLADWAVVNVVDAGVMRRAASAHRDPQKQPLLEEVVRRYPARRPSPSPAALAFESGRSILISDFDDAAVRAYTVDEHHAELARRLDIGSVVAVPLVARGVRVGALTLASEARGRYRDTDLKLAEELARRAAIAIDNVRLLERESRALERLAHVGLAVRDMANTPLQTLTLCVALLQDRGVEEVLSRIRRAVERLRALDGAMSAYSSRIRWTKEDEAFDPLAVITEVTADPSERGR